MPHRCLACGEPVPYTTDAKWCGWCTYFYERARKALREAAGRV